MGKFYMDVRASENDAISARLFFVCGSDNLFRFIVFRPDHNAVTRRMKWNSEYDISLIIIGLRVKPIARVRSKPVCTKSHKVEAIKLSIISCAVAFKIMLVKERI